MSHNLRVLVIGGTGFISSRLVDKLLELNYNVSIFNRGISKTVQSITDRVTFLQGDRDRLSDLEEIAKANQYDIIYDMIAYRPEQSKIAARVFKGRVSRFIHCSTVSVYMVSDDIECPITEDQMDRSLMTYWDRNPFGMEYGIQKRECEEVLWSFHDKEKFPLTILRPTYVSGPGDPAKRDFFWIERLLDGKPLLVPGSGDFAFQQVYIDDVAQAFVDLLSYPETKGEAYNLVSEDIFSLNEYLGALGQLLGKNPEIIHIDQDKFDQLPISYHTKGDVFPFNTRRTAIFSLDKIKRDLKYESTPFHEWMPETIDWFTNKQSSHSTGYENRAEEFKYSIQIQN